MKKLSQHGTTWNSQVMMLSVMVRTFVTLCRDKCVWSYVTLCNSAQGIWNIKDKKEVCISIFAHGGHLEYPQKMYFNILAPLSL